MSPAVVIVPVMLLIVAAAATLVAVLAFPYRGKRVPSSVWGAAQVDRALEGLADQLGVGRHPDAVAPPEHRPEERPETVSAGSSTLRSSTAPRE